MIPVLAGISAILLLAWGADLAARRQAAAVRHAIWTCAILACLAFPALRTIAPRRRAPPAPAVAMIAVSPAPPVHVSVTGEPSIGVAEIAGWIWLAGSLICGFVLIADVLRMRKILRASRRVPIRAPVPVRMSAHAAGPFLAGFLEPAIILPADFDSWPPQRRRAVLMHEFAHVRRRDSLMLLASRILTAAYWFHPLCWLAARRARMESERACDDAALRLGFAPSSYAGHLVSIARMFNPQPAIPMAAMSQLESRVKSILNPSAKRSSAGPRHWAISAILTLCAAVPLATFSSGQQQSSGGTADLSGFVIDPSGARIVHASVVAVNPAVGNREITTTDATGMFAFHSIPAGRYTLEIRVPGFDIYQQNNVTVAAGTPVAVNAALTIGGITEKLSVIAEGTPRLQAQPAGPPARIRIGGNVQAANLLSKVNPVYPPDLQAQGVEGTVLIDAVISKEGVPLSVKVQNSAVNPEFADAAIDAVRQWRYSPTLLNGEPVEVATTMTIEFKLKQ
jgi:TonB family protein